MAQTISIQRGTTTITNNSVGTLFTNGSGGFGTRVIINQLAFSGTNNASGNRDTGGVLINNGSGVGQTPIGVVGSGGQRLGFAAPFLSSTVASSPTFNTGGDMRGNLVGVPAMNLSGSVGISTSTNFPFSSIMPQTFWIGPSDVIQVRPIGFIETSGKSTANASVTVYYSFTLITES